MVRGEIFRLRPERRRRGAEQRGARFAVVVQSDELGPLSTVLVTPTSQSASRSTFRPVVEIEGTPTLLMAEQTTAVALDRLGRPAGRLSARELRELDEALELVLGL